MAETVKVGDEFRLEIIAAERHPLSRTDARGAFREFQRRYEEGLAADGVRIIFRGVPIDSPSVSEDTQLVPLADGSIGWRHRVVYTVQEIDPDSPLLEYGTLPGSMLTAGPVLLTLAVLALVAAAIFSTLQATNALEELSTSATKVLDSAAEAFERASKAAERLSPPIEGALVLGLAIAVLLILR